MGLFKTLFAEKVEIRSNLGWVINLTDQSDYTILRELRMEWGENNMMRCTCYPRDLYKPNIDDDDAYKEYTKKLSSPITILLEKGCRESYAVGDLSPESEIIFYFPKFTTEINHKLMATKVFKMIEPIIAKNHAMEDAVEIININAIELKQLLLSLGSGEISDRLMGRFTTLITSIANATQSIQEKTQEKKIDEKIK